ncbi:hypothetical protein [Salarchaeum sp. JOR-1]|uniref:hypothetical protein n=1 Tax=Salarchaeum sp. JOR-1 TaxID=2599399 RepID=UPI0011989D63|nr:hypothetical protein [Salarchaeum sp. JOR-1]QDX41295.1 hypothetical protein FQU85_10445 [Salarchaeum sp. JOR-1]
MFNLENKRTRLLAVAVVFTLLLAGCSSQPQPVTETTPDSVEVPPSTTAVDTQTTRQTTETTTSQTRRSTGTRTTSGETQTKNESAAFPSANLSAAAKLRAEQLVGSFYEQLPTSQSERKQSGLAAAEAICDGYQGVSASTSLSAVEENGGLTKKLGRRIAYTTQIVNSEFSADVPTHSAETLRGITSDATKYVPLATSYQRMSESACTAVETKNPEDLKEFYASTVVFGVDTMLISTGAYYGPAFVGTRFLTNKASQAGLYRLRYVIGNRGWALGMSEIHFALRGKLSTTASSMMNEVAQRGLNMSREDIDWEYIAQAQGATVNDLVEAGANPLPESASWSYNSSNRTKRVEVTVGNETRIISVPVGLNSSSLEYSTEVANVSELSDATKGLLIQAGNTTDIAIDTVTGVSSDIANASGGLIEDAENATDCATTEDNSSEGGWRGVLDETADAVKECVSGDEEGDEDSEGDGGGVIPWNQTNIEVSVRK